MMLCVRISLQKHLKIGSLVYTLRRRYAERSSILESGVNVCD